ncbi:glycosyltransferase family 4 protein [soil metagenome]
MRGTPARPLDVVLLNWRDSTHPEGGGAEVYAETVAAGLAARGHRITLFCADHGGAPRDEVRDGYRVVRRGSRTSVYLRAALRGLRGGFGRPDFIVDVQNGMPFLARSWSRSPVVVLVHHVHREQWGVVFGPLVARVGWAVESRLAPRLHRRTPHVAVSGVTRDELAELGLPRSAITVVHNGTARPLHTEVARTAHPSIVVLGRLVPHKRVEIALAAVARLAEVLPDLRLTVVGQGWWEPHLRAEAARLGVTDRVDFLGHVDDTVKARVLAESWLLAVPSLKEGWGLAVVEAASHGTPAVAFHGAGGLAESIVDGVTGRLVDGTSLGSPHQAFAEVLAGLLDDAATRAWMGRHARAHAGQFTWERTVERFEQVLEQAVHGAQALPVREGTPAEQEDRTDLEVDAAEQRPA